MNIKYIYTYIYRHLDTYIIYIYIYIYISINILRYIYIYIYIVKVFNWKKHFLLSMFRHVLFIKISLYTYISIYITQYGKDIRCAVSPARDLRVAAKHLLFVL